MSRELSQSVGQAALAAGDAALDSVVTIGARLPIMMGHLVSPSAAGIAEWHEAASEKVLAIWEGTMAAASGWTEFAFRSLLTPLTPTGYAQEAVVLVRAISEPGHRRVRANAARFRDL